MRSVEQRIQDVQKSAEMEHSGMSLKEIAKELGYPTERAFYAMKWNLKRNHPKQMKVIVHTPPEARVATSFPRRAMKSTTASKCAVIVTDTANLQNVLRGLNL